MPRRRGVRSTRRRRASSPDGTGPLARRQLPRQPVDQENADSSQRRLDQSDRQCSPAEKRLADRKKRAGTPACAGRSAECRPIPHIRRASRCESCEPIPSRSSCRERDTTVPTLPGERRDQPRRRPAIRRPSATSRIMASETSPASARRHLPARRRLGNGMRWRGRFGHARPLAIACARIGFGKDREMPVISSSRPSRCGIVGESEQTVNRNAGRMDESMNRDWPSRCARSWWELCAVSSRHGQTVGDPSPNVNGACPRSDR